MTDLGNGMVTGYAGRSVPLVFGEQTQATLVMWLGIHTLVSSPLRADCQIWLCAVSENRQLKPELIHLF